MAQRRESYQIPGVAHSGGGVRGFLPFGARVGDYLASGGTMGQDPATGKVVEGAEKQAEFAFRNLQTLLDTAGFKPTDIVRMWAWIKDNSLRNIIDKPFQAMVPDPAGRPAVTTVIADLPGEMVIQLEIVAKRGAGQLRSFSVPNVDQGVLPAISVKDDLFATGLLTGHDPKTGKLPEALEAQAENVYEKLQMCLDAAGAKAENVAHMFSWYQDHRVRDVINVPFKKLFPDLGDRPNRHSIIRELPPGEAVQTEAMGTIGQWRSNYTVHGVAHGGIDGLINSLPLGCGIGDLVYSAGTPPADPSVHKNPPSPEDQAEFTFLNNKRLLEAAGLSLDDVVHMFVFFKDPKYRDAVNVPWVKYFPNIEDRPARHAIKAELPGDMLIQVELIAVRP
jgi:2-iminobutanoate/2-iminopropanoate deaminase